MGHLPSARIEPSGRRTRSPRATVAVAIFRSMPSSERLPPETGASGAVALALAPEGVDALPLGAWRFAALGDCEGEGLPVPAAEADVTARGAAGDGGVELDRSARRGMMMGVPATAVSVSPRGIIASVSAPVTSTTIRIHSARTREGYAFTGRLIPAVSGGAPPACGTPAWRAPSPRARIAQSPHQRQSPRRVGRSRRRS